MEGDMLATGIPVVHYGTVIGVADISADGRIEMQLKSEDTFTKDLVWSIEKGTTEGLSIAPTMRPAFPTDTV